MGLTLHPMGKRFFSLPEDFQNGLIDPLRRIPDPQGGHGRFHRLPAGRVAENAGRRLKQRLSGAIRFQRHRRAAGFFQSAGVFLLVVVG